MTFLEDIVKQRKSSGPHKIAYELLKKLCDIYVDIPKQDFLKLCDDNDVLKILLKREHRSIETFSDVDKQLREAKADDLFFFSNIDKKRANSEKKTKGLFLIPQSDLHLLERACYNQYRPFNLAPKKSRDSIGEVEFEPIYSWKEVFKGVDMTPINAAVITDNFMFTEKFSERKEYSLYALLKEIVQPTLEIPFHLTIFFNNEKGMFKKAEAEDIVKEIHSLNLCKDLKVSIVSHVVKNTTHDREILTNYHYMYSGKGFSVIDSRGIQEVAKGEIKSVYHCISTIPTQTTAKHLHTQTLNWLKQIYDGKRGTTPACAFTVGDDFKNRLLYD